ncbi:MAG TPA: glycosyltransferase family A protein [bacterium]|nr:glycosyltransferase family A protein [bacterium]
MKVNCENKEFVDVIITTCNRPQFISEAIETVINQTYNFLKIIVVDDGSISASDNCTAIKKNFQKKYIFLQANRLFSADETNKILKNKIIYFYYIYQKNSGISQARNTGIKLSKSEYIAFLDDDNLWHKNKIAKQMEILKNTRYKVCYTNEKWLKNGRHLNQCKKHKKYSGDIFAYTLPLCIISASSILLKKSVINKIGIFDSNFIVCEDYEYWLRLTFNYAVYFIDEQLIIKRGGHNCQLSKRYFAMDRFRLAALLKFLNMHWNLLTDELKKIIVAELQKKSKILYMGYLKRGKINESEIYRKICECQDYCDLSKNWRDILQ